MNICDFLAPVFNMCKKPKKIDFKQGADPLAERMHKAERIKRSKRKHKYDNAIDDSIGT